MERDRKAAWSQPLAAFVERCAAPAFARQGFAQSELVTRWPEIAGARVARFAEPVRLRRRARAAPGEPGVLVLRVEGAFAVELQHLAPVLLDRINAHLGWRAVGRLDLRQAPLLGQPRAEGRASAPAPDPEAIRRAGTLTEGVADAGLRAALTRLGARALRTSPPSARPGSGFSSGAN